MNAAPYLLAQVEVDDVLATWRSMHTPALGALILICAVSFVSLLALVWAAFFRKTKRRRHSHHRSHRHSSAHADSVEAPSGDAAESAPREHPRRRRFRRRHHSRNPTLAETGGLPPVRPEGPPEPQT